MSVDPAIRRLLPIPSSSSATEDAQISVNRIGGGTSSATTSRITVTLPSSPELRYFLKTCPGSSAKTMFAGEHSSLNALGTAVPGICPRSLGYGKLDGNSRSKAGDEEWFLLTEYIDFSSSPSSTSSSQQDPPPSLASLLARLHSTPAPIPDEFDGVPQFGFPVTTCCGDTPQENDFCASWAEFLIERRFRAMLRRIRITQGKDGKFEEEVERICTKVIGRLVGNDHLKPPPAPVLVHGDLWSGNTRVGRIDSSSASTDSPKQPQPLIFDPSAFYAHSEWDAGIMRMFGGSAFNNKFWDEYHALVPKAEPAAEWEDRTRLYEAWHCLNHYAMFGGGYKSSALAIFRDLLRKYGDDASRAV